MSNIKTSKRMKRAARPMPDFQNDRDATLKLIDWFQIDRVRAAKVLVIGAGAIGNEVLKNLALLSVGHIVIFDRDTIEMSNLSRSVLYRASDNGHSKAETAARALRELNPSVKTRALVGDIQFDLGLGLLRHVNVVIGCLDNRVARYLTNRMCWRVGRPWVDAGIGQLNGQARVFRPGHGACYECSLTNTDLKEINVSCGKLAQIQISQGKIPTTPTIASIVAGVQVQEALKLLDTEKWGERILSGREFIFNGTVGESSVVSMNVREDCDAHGRTIPPEEVVELPEATAAGTTAADLLAIARRDLGPSAVLGLNFDLAVDLQCSNLRCRAHGRRERVLRPDRKLRPQDLPCADCETPRTRVWANILGGAPEDYQEDFLDRSLADLGVPPLDIIPAYGDGERYYELTGDAAHVLDFGE